MCLNPPSSDNSAAIEQQKAEAEAARQAEIARQARIKEGLAAIDKQFEGFNDAYYADRSQAYRDYYQPDLDRQAEDARKNITYALARSGQLAGSTASDKRGRLEQDIALRQGELESKALGAASSLRSQVADDKASLERELQATSDAEAAKNAALSQAQVRQQQPIEYSPLGDLFTAAAAGIGAAKQNADSAYYRGMSARLFDNKSSGQVR